MLKLPKLAKDISGQKFNMLTAVEYVGSQNGARWLFKCDCGNAVKHNASMVKGGHIRSCGCASKDNQFSASPITAGQIFGNATALHLNGVVGHNLEWSFLCSCGVFFSALASNVRSGNTTSCGCQRKVISKEKATKHGLSHTTSYGLWQNMIRRCHDEKSARYSNYGGRGIFVCERWRNFENFFSDMGVKPKGKSLDRIDNNKSYSPENCKWSTAKEQCRNTRFNAYITIDGETKTVAEWAEITGVPYGRINQRRVAGWEDHELFIPVRARRK